MELLSCVIILLMSVLIVKTIWQKHRGNQLCLHNFDKKTVLPIRGILALLIIMHHLSLQMDYIPVFSQLRGWGYYCVAMFFFFMGYGLHKSYMVKGKEYLQNLVLRHTTKLLPAFLLCVTLYVLYNFIQQRVSFYTILIELKHGGTDNLLPTSWFVFVTLLYYPSYKLIMRYSQSLIRGTCYLFVWSLTFMAITRFLGFGSWWWMSIFATNLGHIFAIAENKIHNILQNHLLFLELCILTMFVVLFIIMPTYIRPLPTLFRMFMVTIFPIYVVLPIIILGTSYFRGIWNNLGKISYEIYLVQGALCYKLLFLYEQPIVYILTTIIMSCTIAYLLHRVLNLRKTGNRNAKL